MPDSVEALLTPREIPALYPGDQLLGYCSLFRVDGFRPHPPGVGLGWGVGSGPGMAEALASPPTPSSISRASLPDSPTTSRPPQRPHWALHGDCNLPPLESFTELSCKVLPWLLPQATKPHRHRESSSICYEILVNICSLLPSVPYRRHHPIISCNVQGQTQHSLDEISDPNSARY